jgi:RHS repeat-associated protein
VYDSYGRDVATIDALGNRTTMVLDGFGRQVNEVDADSNTTTFVYDGLNRVVNETSATGGLSTMTYDADGRLATSTDPLGREITYSYDAVGNNTGQTWLNADTTVQGRLTFTYDANNRLLTAANSVGTYTVTYTAVGEIATAKDPWSDLLTFIYDGAGHRTKVQDNFNGVTSNVYDASGNLTQQEFGGTGQTPMRIDQAYNANNLLTDVTRYRDLAGTTKVATTSHVYDVAGQLTSQIDKTGGGSSIANYTWVYDAAGRLTSETLNSGSPVTYTYDSDNQLTGDTVATHTYDAEGNRTGTGYSTATGNELQSDPGWNYSYDATGDETKKVAISGGQTWKYTYDDKNELTSAKLWSADPDYVGTAVLQKEVDYKYDAWGNLAERSDDPDGSGPISASVTHYAVDGWNPALAGATGTSNFNVWAELDGNNSNALLTRYLHGDEVDGLVGRQDAGVAYWYLTDRLGSVRDVTDNSGNVKDALVYDGFGNIVTETNSAYRGNYSWTGRQVDTETRLQYNRARWYDSATSRWQSQDPIGFAAGDSNLHRYLRNQPLSTIDPSGMEGWIRRLGGALLVLGSGGAILAGWELYNAHHDVNVIAGVIGNMAVQQIIWDHVNGGPRENLTTDSFVWGGPDAHPRTLADSLGAGDLTRLNDALLNRLTCNEGATIVSSEFVVNISYNLDQPRIVPGQAGRSNIGVSYSVRFTSRVTFRIGQGAPITQDFPLTSANGHYEESRFRTREFTR